MSPSRGVLYVKWGSRMDNLLQRSVISLRQHHPELPVHVHELPAESTLLAKAQLFAFSPFQETLYLDVDTTVLARLDYGFSQAFRHGLACSLNENPCARRYVGLQDQGDLIEYNTGVLFFTRAAAPFFDRWVKLAPLVNSMSRLVAAGKIFHQPQNDQASFAKAIDEVAAETGRAPFVLPPNWNFRPLFQGTFFGDLKIWHDYEPPDERVVRWSKLQGQPDAIIQFTQLQTPLGPRITR